MRKTGKREDISERARNNTRRELQTGKVRENVQISDAKPKANITICTVFVDVH